MFNFKLTKNKIIVFIINLVLFSIYIFPTGILNDYVSIPLDKLIFILGVLLVYILTIKKMSKSEILFLFFVFIFVILSGNIEYILFLSIPLLMKLIKYKKLIKYYLKRTPVLYICLIMTLIYSVIYNIGDGRMAYSAIREINQSGLAIFCLACLLIQKNIYLSLITFILGFLTLSRSYMLAVLCIIFFRLSFIKNFLKKFNLNIFNFVNLTILSSFILYMLGVIYIYQYKAGNIVDSTNLNSKLTLLDTSNLFRFFVIYVIISVYISNPAKIFVGITDNEYVNFLSKISNSTGIPYHYTVPHNLFFSHLKIYGIFAVIEIIYVSNILKKIVNEQNFGIYVAIALYSIILGAGLYSYWLYLTVFGLIVFDDNIKISEMLVHNKS